MLLSDSHLGWWDWELNVRTLVSYKTNSPIDF